VHLCAANPAASGRLPSFTCFSSYSPPRQVVEETHAFYNKLRSGARANTEELSLV
jgi:hypothetical protein